MHYNYVVREELRRFIMGVPISIRLDDEVRAELEAQAQSRGIGLATLLRDLATEAARATRRARIRQASAATSLLDNVWRNFNGNLHCRDQPR